MKQDPKKWIHPQAVPRGFLRLYLLLLLSRQPETGYSMMQAIDERTEGAWRPGPGTVYPLLRSLKKDGLVRQLNPKAKGSKITYVVTEKGKSELEEMQRTVASAGRREQSMMRLFVDLLPPTAFTTMVVRRGREMSDIFKDKIMQVPQPERDSILKEMRVVLENQLAWIVSLVSLRIDTQREQEDMTA